MTNFSLSGAALIVCVATAALVGCGGFTSAPWAALPQHLGSGAGGPRATSSCATSRCIYVVNGFGSSPSITVYPENANGDVSPVRTISGSNTKLNAPAYLAFDTSGNLYVTNLGNASVTVYAANANGNVSPIKTISGKHTDLQNPYGIALDATSQIYVADVGGRSPSNPPAIYVFAAEAKGNVAPIRVVSGSATGLSSPEGIALHGKGSAETATVTDNFTLTTYLASASGNVPPLNTIGGARTLLGGPTGVAIAQTGEIYVSDNPKRVSRVLVFSSGATGDVKPTADIKGPDTGLGHYTEGIAADRRDIYVADSGDSTVSVFAKTSNGNVAPIRRIIGSHTGLVYPIGVAIH